MARRLFIIFIIIEVIYVGYKAESATHWGPWKANRKHCQRQCADPYGIIEFYRECLVCEISCRSVNTSQCQGEAVQMSWCYAGNDCTGDGVYTGQMSPWIPASLCPHPNLSCNGKMRIFKRTCQRTDKSSSSEVRCPGDKFTERKEPCICGVDDPAAIAVSDPHWGWLPRYGVWSEWSKWNCEQPCINVTRRTRQCIREPRYLFDCPMDAEGRLTEEVMPCRIDGELLCRSQGEDVLCPGGSCLKVWSSWTEWSRCQDVCDNSQMRSRERKCLNTYAQCFGESEELKPCPRNETICKPGHHRVTRTATPIDGGWTEWSATSCSMTLGLGVKYRRRLCTNPWPEAYGKPCPGYSKMMVSETCLVNLPDPFSANWDEVMYSARNKTMQSYSVRRGDDVFLFCASELRELVEAKTNNTDILWIFNGVQIHNDDRRSIIEDVDTQTLYLHLRNVQASDSGTYECSTPNWYIDVMTVTVYNPVPTRYIETGESVILHCLEFGLPEIVNGLMYVWKHNDLLVGALAPIIYTHRSSEPNVTTTKYIHSVTESDTGLWECFVIEEFTKRMWKTNSFRLSYKQPPKEDNILTDIRDLDTAIDAEFWSQSDKKTRAIKRTTISFGVVALLGIIVIIPLTVISCKQYRAGYQTRSDSVATLVPNKSSYFSLTNKKLHKTKSSNSSMYSLWFKKPDKATSSISSFSSMCALWFRKPDKKNSFTTQ